MANLENGMLKLIAAKGSTVVFPLGMIGIAAFWVWNARNRQREQSTSDGSGAAGSRGKADVGRTPRGATGAARPGARAAYNAATGATSRGSTDREALLSQILEENLRLREALK